MPAPPYQQMALLQAALQEQLQNLTPATRQGLSNQAMPGRVPSALALNAYIQGMPSAGDRDAEYEATRTAQKMDDDRELDARTKARLSDPYEAAKAIAEARSFNTRRNVREAPPDGLSMDPVSSHGPTVRNISRLDGPTAISGVRRFSDAGGEFADPDAALSSGQRTMMDPRVVAAEITANAKRNPAPTAKELAATKDADAAQAKQDDNRAEIVRLAQKLHDSPALDPNVGPIDAAIPSWLTLRGGGPGGSREFTADVQRLKDMIALGNRSQLKGQGAVSDFEGRMLANAGTSLNFGTDEASFRRELRRIIADHTKGSSSAATTTPSGNTRQVGRFTIEE